MIAQFQLLLHLHKQPFKISAALVKNSCRVNRKETASYNKLLDRKFLDQFTDISPAAADGKISHLFIATSLLLLLKTMKCHLKSMIVANFKHHCLPSHSKRRSSFLF